MSGQRMVVIPKAKLRRKPRKVPPPPPRPGVFAKNEVICGCCKNPMPKAAQDLCSGCGKYICQECPAAVMGFGHQPWMHKACDHCGEPVCEEGASFCERCQ